MMKVALIGIGEIARAQHIPAISQSPQWELAATVSRSSQLDGIENFTSIEDMLSARPDIPVVSLCAPPLPRFEMARAALQSGRHVILEKPPGATVGECRLLQSLAERTGSTLYATWHSREAAATDHCRNWLKGKRITGFSIDWKEDVRRWHPGQEWIWQTGGLGVFDPGINALSILTKILPESVHLSDALLETPANKQTPIAASLTMVTASGARGKAHFDWRQEGEDIWEISIETDSGRLCLSEGGATLTIDGVRQENSAPGASSLSGEYPRLYENMHQLVTAGKSDCDFRPLELVADAFLLGSRQQVGPYDE